MYECCVYKCVGCVYIVCINEVLIVWDEDVLNWEVESYRGDDVWLVWNRRSVCLVYLEERDG